MWIVLNIGEISGNNSVVVKIDKKLPESAYFFYLTNLQLHAIIIKLSGEDERSEIERDGDHTEKIFEKTLEKDLTKFWECDIIEKLTQRWAKTVP